MVIVSAMLHPWQKPCLGSVVVIFLLTSSFCKARLLKHEIYIFSVSLDHNFAAPIISNESWCYERLKSVFGPMISQAKVRFKTKLREVSCLEVHLKKMAG